MRSLHEDVVDERREAKLRNEEELQSESRSERQQWAMMDEMGLDADAALQYAMMLSMEEQGEGGPSQPMEAQDQDGTAGPRAAERSVDDEWSQEIRYGDDQVDEAVRAVEEYRRKEEEDMRYALEQIRIAEERERR